MAKKVDPKAKAKRQKINAGIGGVLLLAVLAFQVPRTLKMLHPAERDRGEHGACADDGRLDAAPSARPPWRR